MGRRVLVIVVVNQFPGADFDEVLEVLLGLVEEVAETQKSDEENVPALHEIIINGILLIRFKSKL